VQTSCLEVEVQRSPKILDQSHLQATATMLFKNVLAAGALASTAFAAPTEEKRQSKLQWFGINESGAEFGEKNFTGVYGKEYIWYDFNTIDQFLAQGMNMFRLNFRKLLAMATSSHLRTIPIILTFPSDGAPDPQHPHWPL
jgi:aryl-phospho-beta-D-glucosidase BglC (GH1 family)